jgi:uncharacterized membrane protein YccF (DUF307 family)
MRTLLNLLWMTVGGGFVIALQYALGGLILMLTIVGIPFGLQCMKLAWLSLVPFGKEIEMDPGGAGEGLLPLLMNIVWFIFGGLTTFLSHLTLALGLAVTIIGIPFAYQHMKLAVMALFPFGRRIVDADTPLRVGL